MVKVSLYESPFDRFGIQTLCDWVEEALGEPTVKNMDADEILQAFDHHYYEGNDCWQYHFVRTTMEPASADRHLYRHKTARNHLGEEGKFLEALYFIFPDEHTALQMLLALS